MVDDIRLSPKQKDVYNYIKWEALMPMNCGLALFGFKEPLVSNGMYEQFFHMLYPKLEQQVVFGTSMGVTTLPGKSWKNCAG